MVKITINLLVTPHTAVSVGAGGSTGTLADKTIMRDGWGRPIIPGSQVKGKVRHTTEALALSLGIPHVQQPFAHDNEDEENSELPDNVIRTLFGSERCKSPLFFADLVGFIGARESLDDLRDKPEQYGSQIRPSVAINRRRGVADDARLLFQETTLEGCRFYAQAAIQGHLPDEEHAALLWSAVRLVTRWGGAASRGLGWAAVQADMHCDDSVWDTARLPDCLEKLVQRERNRHDR
jgi:CRISPR/Cas system CSM-associated protein Csm3 (group 7 of RAMP superfamily)